MDFSSCTQLAKYKYFFLTNTLSTKNYENVNTGKKFFKRIINGKRDIKKL